MNEEIPLACQLQQLEQVVAAGRVLITVDVVVTVASPHLLVYYNCCTVIVIVAFIPSLLIISLLLPFFRRIMIKRLSSNNNNDILRNCCFPLFHSLSPPCTHSLLPSPTLQRTRKVGSSFLSSTCCLLLSSSSFPLRLSFSVSGCIRFVVNLKAPRAQNRLVNNFEFDFVSLEQVSEPHFFRHRL